MAPVLISRSEAQPTCGSASESEPDSSPDTKRYAFVILHEQYPTHPEDTNKARYIYHSLGAAKLRLQAIRDNVPNIRVPSTTLGMPDRVAKGDPKEGFGVLDEDGEWRHTYWIEKVRLGDGCMGEGSGV